METADMVKAPSGSVPPSIIKTWIACLLGPLGRRWSDITVEDLMKFMKALFTVGSNGIFQNQSTLDAFLTMPAAGTGNFFGMDGGYGINRFTYTGIGTCYADFGFFTTNVVHCPSKNIYFTTTANQSESTDARQLLSSKWTLVYPRKQAIAHTPGIVRIPR
jgi:hypothetical protein